MLKRVESWARRNPLSLGLLLLILVWAWNKLAPIAFSALSKSFVWIDSLQFRNLETARYGTNIIQAQTTQNTILLFFIILLIWTEFYPKKEEDKINALKKKISESMERGELLLQRVETESDKKEVQESVEAMKGLNVQLGGFERRTKKFLKISEIFFIMFMIFYMILQFETVLETSRTKNSMNIYLMTESIPPSSHQYYLKQIPAIRDRASYDFLITKIRFESGN